MSEQAASDQFVTKEEFSRLENELRARFDEMMGVVRGRASRRSSTYDRTVQHVDYHHYEDIDSQRPPEILLNQINQSLEQLETRLCDRLTKQVTSQFQTEIEDVKMSIQKLSLSVNESKRQTIDQIQKKVETHGQKMEHIVVEEIQKTVESQCQKIEKNVAERQRTLESHDKNPKRDKKKKAVESLNKEMEESAIKVEIQKAVESHGEKMKESILNSFKEHGEKMKESILNSLNEQSDNTRIHINKKMTENKELLGNDMYKLKHEIFGFTEKECQLLRDRIEGPLPSHKTYTLDFYVEYFRDLISSGTIRYSQPWHINQFKSSIKGMVTFLDTGKMTVWMLYGRHPREVGLQFQQCEGLQVKATITDIKGKLPDLHVGEKIWSTINEENIPANMNHGIMLGEIDCQKIVSDGYADTAKKAALVRYVVDVLEVTQG